MKSIGYRTWPPPVEFDYSVDCRQSGTPLRVAVDATAARSLTHGVGTYVAGLLSGLAAADAVNDYRVFMSRAAISAFEPLGLPARFNFQPVTGNRPLRLVWEAFGLPGEAHRARAALLWGCHNSLPRVKKGPQVVTIHDLGMLTVPQFYPRTKVAYFRRALPHAARAADRIVADSEFTRRELVELLGVPEAKVRVVLCGVGPQFTADAQPRIDAAVRERYGLPADFILALGVLEPKKNLERVVRACFGLRASRPDFPKLVIAGARDLGWDNDRLFSAAAALKSGVIFTGRIAPEDLPSVYRLARVFVFPSLYEGFGLPPLEAMACNTPVITSNTASLPEVAGGAALLVDPAREDEIAAAILRLVDDSALGGELRARGRANAARFRWDNAARVLLEVFREAGQS